LLFESRIIGDYLDAAYQEYPLYFEDPLKRAMQHHLMTIMDALPVGLFATMMTRGQLESELIKLTKTLEKLNLALKQSKTVFFLDAEHVTMVECHGFPFIARLFHMKSSPNKEF